MGKVAMGTLYLAMCMLPMLAQLHDGEGLALAAGAENPKNITTPIQLKGGSVLLTPTQNTFLVSPNNVFALGFLKTPISSSSSSSTEPSFTLSVFYSSLSQFLITPVWTPHRGHLLTQNATLNFTVQGDLVLSDAGKQIWHTNTTASGDTSIHISDQGNVLLYGENSIQIWQSWDEPITDTLLPGQTLLPGTDVVDNKGRYLLRVQTDSNVVLYFLGSLAVQTTNHYWASNTWNLNVSQASYYASQGIVLLDIRQHTVQTLLQASLSAELERIVLSESGVLTRYMLSADGKSWSVAAQVPSSICYVMGLCGPYGICMDDMDNYNCTCPVGFNYVDENDWSAGCGTNYPPDCDMGSKLTSLPGVQYGATYSSAEPTWSDYHYSDLPSTLDLCAQSCDSSCQCVAATYDGQICHLSRKGQVYSGNRKSSAYVTYLKTSMYPDNSTHNYTLGEATVKKGETKRVVSVRAAVGIGVTLGLACTVGLANLGWWYYRSRQSNMNEDDVEGAEDEVPLLGGGPVQFSYKELKEASNGFKNLLGRGGFGPVYKGVLAGGALVAIKRLEGSTYGEKQFRAEVITIGSIHHMNLVRLCGYCAKGPHRLLVYELMPRGSLDRYIFHNKSTAGNPEGLSFLDWETRFQILLSTARAIRYLHEECQPCIVHCDIKPENILLGEAFNAKVSDFGMAQLVGGEAGHTGSITRVRGTFGYMAPEWMSSKHITTKVDVYSFGIVVLEVISGRRAIEIDAESDSKVDLSTWAYSQVMGHCAAVAILDPHLRLQARTDAPEHTMSTSTHSPQLGTTEDVPASDLAQIAPELDRAAFVALWCIHKDPSISPSMGLVVQLLEGIMPVDPPPYPF